MVYALVLEASVERHGGSSPLLGTNSVDIFYPVEYNYPATKVAGGALTDFKSVCPKR